jgi:2-(1,2-epoxy-1,2-dihydrophenyl)acetyl-CoA isomerase
MDTGREGGHGTLVKVDIDGGVARLELNRPHAANAIDLRLAVDLEAAARRLQESGDLRVVLLSGAGARFCGGGDVAHLAAQGQARLADELGQITAHLHAAVSILAGLDAPVVAVVQGSAAGAGFGLVLASDLVIAARSARFVMAYTGIGLVPDGSTSWFLPRLVGHRRATELALTNRVLTADEALEWGIVTTVVNDDRLSDATDALIDRLAHGPTGAFGRTAALLRSSSGHTLDEHLRAERVALIASGRSADGWEGITAFASKRAPHFGPPEGSDGGPRSR